MGAEDMSLGEQQGVEPEIAATSGEGEQPKADVKEDKKMTPKEEKIVEKDGKAIRTFSEASQTIRGLFNDYKLVTDNYVTDQVVYQRVMVISDLLNNIDDAIDQMTALQTKTKTEAE